MLFSPVFIHTELRSVESPPRSFTLSGEGLGSPSSFPTDPQQLLFYKHDHPITNLESTLLQVFILKNLKPFEINTSTLTKNRGRGGRYGYPNVLRKYLAERLAGTQPSILRTFFQVPYPATPLFATLTKTPGVYGYSSHFGTTPTPSKSARIRMLSSALLLALGTRKRDGNDGARP